MREIKFRAWDKVNNRMIDHKYICVLLKNVGRNNQFHYMQYTGLKDKNGKEIYEGDIIEFQSGIEPQRTIIEFQIHCYNAGFYPREGANANCYWEIIGNVHQTEKHNG